MQTNPISRNRNPRRIPQLPVIQPKRPEMQWTQSASIVDIPLRQTSPRVRTGIVQRVHLAVIEKHGHLKPINLDVFPLPFSQFIKRAQ
jgi:hypothetical protein